MRAYSQDGEGEVMGWDDDFELEGGDRDAEDAEAEDAEFEDFAASCTPVEVCDKIADINTKHFYGVLGIELPENWRTVPFDPETMERSPQPVPGALDYELAANTQNAVLTALPTENAGNAVSAPGVAPQAPLAAYRLPTQATTRMKFNEPRSEKRHARISVLLNNIHSHLSEGRVVTNRGLYYLVGTSHQRLFPTPTTVTSGLSHCVRLLRCNRRSMGITTAGRGLVTGRIKIKSVDQVWRDYTWPDMPPFEIPGDVHAITHGDFEIQMRTDASYFLIVEKHSVFDKLKNEAIWARLGIVLITAKGFPDLATRAFIKRMQLEFPNTPTLLLVDWNPSGVLILKQYRHGSARSALESANYALHVGFLGVRFGDLRKDANNALVNSIPLTDRDKSKITNLLLANDETDPGGKIIGDELRKMRELGRKAEIESLYPIADEIEIDEGHEVETFGELVVGKIVRGEYS